MSPSKKKSGDGSLESGATQAGVARASSPGSAKAGKSRSTGVKNPGHADNDVQIAAATDEILAHYPLEEPSLIMVLQELNDQLNWLPPIALVRVADKLNLPFGKVQGVATFYRAFSLEPKGKKTVKVCTGTACHVRGAGMLVDELKRSLDIEPGHGISDGGDYSLETVNCVGACAMTPVLMVSENYYANMSPGGIAKMLKKEKPA